MEKCLAVAGLVLALAFPSPAVPSARNTGSPRQSSSSSDKKVYVHGYYRKDGTYVPAHYRAAPGTASAPKPYVPSATPRSTGTAAAHPASATAAGPHPRGCQTCPRDARGRILRDPEARRQFLRMTGYPHGRPGYVVDHIIPLECGGADTPANMQWQTVAEAKAKDKSEANCRR